MFPSNNTFQSNQPPEPQAWTYVIKRIDPEGSKSEPSSRSFPPRGVNVREELPGTVYKAIPCPNVGEPGRIYGSFPRKVDKILKTYETIKDKTCGVLMIGESGAGKTVGLKLISEMARERLKLPTVIVNEAYSGDNFCRFIQQLPECVIVIEEYEKIYLGGMAQNALLTLFDGIYTTKKLIVLTANSIYGISEFMLQRPGRIRYKLTFSGVEDDVVTEYCNENLINKNYTGDILTIARSAKVFTFDMLTTLVDEVNIHNEPPSECIKILNISPGLDIEYEVSAAINGKPVYEVSPRTFYGNPRTQSFINITIAILEPGAPPVRHQIEIDIAKIEFTEETKVYRYKDEKTSVDIFFTPVKTGGVGTGPGGNSSYGRRAPFSL